MHSLRLNGYPMFALIHGEVVLQIIRVFALRKAPQLARAKSSWPIF